MQHFMVSTRDHPCTCNSHMLSGYTVRQLITFLIVVVHLNHRTTRTLVSGISATSPFPVQIGRAGLTPLLSGAWPTWDTAHAVLTTQLLVTSHFGHVIANPPRQGSANDTCPSYSDNNGIPYVCSRPCFELSDSCGKTDPTPKPLDLLYLHQSRSFLLSRSLLL